MSEEVVVLSAVHTAIGDYGKSLAGVPPTSLEHLSSVKRCLAPLSTPQS